jgi:hypothetical protein
MVRVAAMSTWIIRLTNISTEIPEIDKVSVACAMICGFELNCPGVTLADKRLGRYLGVLDQKVEAG